MAQSDHPDREQRAVIAFSHGATREEFDDQMTFADLIEQTLSGSDFIEVERHNGGAATIYEVGEEDTDE